MIQEIIANNYSFSDAILAFADCNFLFYFIFLINLISENCIKCPFYLKTIKKNKFDNDEERV